ncbi:MAG: glycosyltransferase family 39 protein [Anaerolineae bacterium]
MLPKSRLEWAAFIGIILLAAVLRLGAPGVIEFKRDEAALSQLALGMARGHHFPLLGISSSVGIPNAPFNIYIMALPYVFSSDPTLATQFIGLLNVFAVALTYLLARRYYGITAALVASLSYAASPWGVIYSRKIWAQDLLPFFTLLTLGAGLAGFIEGKKWGQWLHLPLLVITGQIHYGAFVLVPLSLYLIVVGRKRWTRALPLSLIPAALLTVPYLIGLAQTIAPNSGAVLNMAADSGTSRIIAPTTQTLEYALLTISGTDIHSLAGPQRFQDYLDSVPNVYPLFYLLATAVLTVFIGLSLRLWRHRDERSAVDGLLLLWMAFPIVAFSFSWTAIYPHYLIPMMPAAYLLLGIGAQALWDKPTRTWRSLFALAGAVVGAIAALQIWLLLTLFSFLYFNATPDGFGTPLGYLLPIRQAVLEHQPDQIIVDVGGQAVGFDGEATVWNFLLVDVPDVRFVDAATQVYPQQNAAYLSNCNLPEQTQSPDAASQRFDLRPIDLNSTEGCYRLSTLPTFDSQYVHANPDNLAYDNGTRVFGYTWDNQCLQVFWEISARTSQDYSFAVHFVDADGNGIANADALSWQGRYWREGDRVIRRFCLPEANPAIAGVNLGMYTYDGVNFYNANLLDASGTPVGQTLEIRFEPNP